MKTPQFVTQSAAPVPYRGEDRRSRGAATPPPWTLPLAATGVVLAVRLLGAAVPPAVTAPDQVLRLLDLVGVASAVAGSVVAGLCLARWRTVGDAPGLWFGLGSLLYGLGGVGVANVLALPSAGTLEPATLFVALLLFAAGVATPAVDTGLRPWRLLTGALTAAAALTALLGALAPSTVPLATAALVIPAAALAVATMRRGRRERRWLSTWTGVVLTTAAVGALAPRHGVDASTLAAEVLRLAALLLVVRGAVQEMAQSLREQGSRLLRSQVDAQRAEELARAEQELAQERAHEARSALAAIEGATSTLERHRDRLPDDVQRQLAAAVSGEIRRLQTLITPSGAEEPARLFDLLDVLAPLLAVEQARGTRVTCQVPGDLVALGRPTATTEVLQTLFDNARRHAPGSAVVVRAGRDGDRVVVRVEDRGPGIPQARRGEVFERGVRVGDATVPGEGIGLYVASRLAQEQGGRLWVDERPGGGASFALALPLVAGPQLLEEPADRLQRV